MTPFENGVLGGSQKRQIPTDSVQGERFLAIIFLISLNNSKKVSRMEAWAAFLLMHETSWDAESLSAIVPGYLSRDFHWVLIHYEFHAPSVAFILKKRAMFNLERALCFSLEEFDSCTDFERADEVTEDGGVEVTCNGEIQPSPVVGKLLRFVVAEYSSTHRTSLRFLLPQKPRRRQIDVA